MGKYLIIIAFIGIGFALIVYTEPLKRNFIGQIDFAERYLGMGGTYNFLKLVGILLIVFAIAWATGTVERLIPNALLNTTDQSAAIGQ